MHFFFLTEKKITLAQDSVEKKFQRNIQSHVLSESLKVTGMMTPSDLDRNKNPHICVLMCMQLSFATLKPSHHKLFLCSQHKDKQLCKSMLAM